MAHGGQTGDKCYGDDHRIGSERNPGTSALPDSANVNLYPALVELHFGDDVRFARLPAHSFRLEIFRKQPHVAAARIKFLSARRSHVDVDALLGRGKVKQRLRVLAEKQLS